MDKSPEAFRTISEVAEVLETPAHVLRFWETRFPQIRPVKRAGGRRYYRPSDVALLTGIKRLLHEDGLTIRGVQKILREQGIRHVSGLTDDTSPEQEALEAAMAGRFDTEDEPLVTAEEAADATAAALAAALLPAEDNVIAFPRDPNVPDSDNAGLNPAQSFFPGFEPDPLDPADGGATVVEDLPPESAADTVIADMPAPGDVLAMAEPDADELAAADPAEQPVVFGLGRPGRDDFLPEDEAGDEAIALIQDDAPLPGNARHQDFNGEDDHPVDVTPADLATETAWVSGTGGVDFSTIEDVPEAPFIEAEETGEETADVTAFPQTDAAAAPPPVSRFAGWKPLTLSDLAPEAPLPEATFPASGEAVEPPAGETADPLQAAEEPLADIPAGSPGLPHPARESFEDDSDADQTLAARLRAIPPARLAARAAELSRIARALQDLHDRMDRPRTSH